MKKIKLENYNNEKCECNEKAVMQRNGKNYCKRCAFLKFSAPLSEHEQLLHKQTQQELEDLNENE